MFSLLVLPHFAFIAGSGDIYITRLGLSEQAFGYFFALNAAAIMAGSMVCSRMLRHYTSQQLITVGFVGIFLGGLIMLVRWIPVPWGLTLPMAVISFFFGLTRPPSNNFVLEQVDQHAGAASSLLVFIYFMLGALSMWLISLAWPDKIFVIGLLGAASGGTMLCVWVSLPLLGLRDSRRKKGFALAHEKK
jgi:DHA1 family bicyclomycin/chloramphenicol resistance-like MFS transporter